MQNRIVITGMGVISPVGNDVETTWNNIVAGNSGIGPITHFDASDFKTRIAAQVKDFDATELFGSKDARHMDRNAHFGLASAIQAYENSKLEITDSNRDRIGAVIGSGIGGLGTTEKQAKVLFERGPNKVSPFLISMMLSDTAGSMVAIHLGIRGPNWSVVTACATGTNAIGEAAEAIRRGQADVMFAGGTEAAIVPLSVAGMCSFNAMSTRNDDPTLASRPFDKNRDGFVMGEGAGTVILESLEHAQARGANIIAEIVGYGSTNDAFHITAPADQGAGAARCMEQALESSGLDVKDIGYINAHGTSTLLNDKAETAAIKTVFGEQAYSIPVSSTKSMTGHLMGGAGGLEAVICAKAIKNDTLPPTINYETPDPLCDLDYVPNESRKKELNYVMSNSFGFGGHNATIILGKFQEATQ
ncbi:MAG: beta-ketoacyl-ACP synthase II [Chloroflexi bacterium]|nr:beta-ketoacyl-ACP synthase II [Chloroflexota bacterium]MBT3668695.1 beta-ketoacyl-ACP synthase II [Chloroflexota bacterium]MBT4305396.1 beta-ketoacyl-ACP synthase II [Chloroflexota bacterium]MBT4532542.1 beta-ketoacyl-ACP synthase II [Chloroflexota bacterium]MBT4683203.1 beta-ketoacyl-ACP synthase II [Chloroflexota bacterium]